MGLNFQEMLDMGTDVESWWIYEAMIPNMTPPVKLSYTFQQLTDAHLERVIHETFQKNDRTELDLTANRITDVGAAFLAQALQQNQTVIKLGLAWNKIGDTGAKYLAEALRNNTTLNKLDLWGNEITENGVHYLFEALQYNRVLLELEVGAVLVKRAMSIQCDANLNAQMKLLNDKKQFRKALELFDEYKDKNIGTLSRFTILQALKSCAQIRDLQRGSTIHRFMSSDMKKNSYILTSLIHLYMQCGDVVRAQSIFEMSEKKTLSMYGAMMKGYVQNKMGKTAIDLFNEIEVPDEFTTTFLFNACAQLENNEALNVTKKIAKEMPKAFQLDHILLTSLLDALIKCGDVISAEALFYNAKKKTLAMYGAMMKGYIKNNMAKKAIDLFNEIRIPDEITTTLLFHACAQLETNEALNRAKKIAKEMPKSFQSDQILLTSLLDVLIKCGDCASAEIVFSKMKKNVIVYGHLMNGFLKENNPEKTLDLFNQMIIDGIEPNHILYLSVIKALSQVADYSLSQSIVERIPKSIFADRQIQNSLIHMWGKLGFVHKAKEIFENMIEPDQIGYGAMINTYGLNGMGTQAVELYSQMPTEFIHDAIHVSLLNACSHSGLIDQAHAIFKSVQLKTDKIYTSMIDCLSRGSFLDEAQKLIDEFECHNAPSWPMYMALLAGARNAKNNQISQKVFNRMKKLFPDLTDPITAATILLANSYASSGEIDMASKLRQELVKSRRKKQVGLSWTLINGRVIRLRAHDQSHDLSVQIRAEVEKISNELIAHDHKFDSSWITRPLNQDETVESVLCGHSERLAIALNFVANPNVSLIEIKKNLRICGDCHEATKSIAAIRQCEIIIRDANRVHHFHKNGQCSCNDYF
ncbi:unnamed protein product [Rotaria magnacalcarata]|uniref:DYW domain-containing protein n=1 Tax=Rotaria magnacalcarata TaxID=392030 RepID=A0A818XII9_9BILA|nr:unnamed protein product [Rotaria magnacalcarata]CAF3739174.1 unnamed protein product [Rotaria magnacalcarata]CAF3803104.1 unnamed protein product [Rotaria magnacalcarata]